MHACSMHACMYVRMYHVILTTLHLYTSFLYTLKTTYEYINEPPSKSIVYVWYKNIGSFLGRPIAFQCFVQINAKECKIQRNWFQDADP